MSTTKNKNTTTKTIARESETSLVNGTLSVIAALVKDGMFWRNNSGMITTQAGGMVRLSPAGTADIIGILGSQGLFVALEAKVPSRRSNVSARQKEWIDKVTSLGGYAGVFCTIDEALQHIACARAMTLQRIRSTP